MFSSRLPSPKEHTKKIPFFYPQIETTIKQLRRIGRLSSREWCKQEQTSPPLKSFHTEREL